MKWLAGGGEVVGGLVLLLLYLTDVTPGIPYSIFVVLAGTGLLVSGVQRLRRSGG